MKNAALTAAFALTTTLLFAATASAQQVYPTVPDWVSADTPVSTGGALVDLDRDGWLDFVVANGNDMAQQRVTVYYNQGDGTFPPTPDWQSADIAYHGHLDVADVNGDGWPDVAVAMLGEFSTIDHAAKLYLNHNGTLSSLPDWQSAEMANAFGCAFGDVNNDGRPDLAAATGWAYSPQHFFNNYVWINTGGMLASSASWVSDDDDHLQGVTWCDANHDGWLDLVGAASGSQTRVYANLGGTLETTASWFTTDVPNQDSIMAACGDVTGDGYVDLFIADNNQIGGSGRFRQYTGQAAGYFATTAGWTYLEGYASAVALADVDADGDLDLATGAWWDSTRLFLNTGSGLPASPQWSSAVTSVVEKISFGDVDRDGLQVAAETLPADGGRLFELARRPIQDVLEVRLDGVPLAADEYTLHRDGWITTAVAPTVSLEVSYRWSSAPDMTVTNWDNNVGNYLYYNQAVPDFTIGATPSMIEICVGGTADYTVTVGATAGFSSPVTLSASGSPADASFSVNPVTPPGSSVLTISNTGGASAGTYGITISGSASGSPGHSVQVMLDLRVIPGPPTLTAPPNGATDQPLRPTFQWTTVAGADSYALQVDDDPAFGSPAVSQAGILGTTFSPSFDLQPETTYYWRVRAENLCGTGAASTTFSLTTQAGEPALPFEDGFESGDTSAWSATVPGGERLPAALTAAD